ncbi:MAG: hypothetical protein R3D26_19575 [Cyanobacteriota/Melainabacteria group bacterium]
MKRKMYFDSGRGEFVMNQFDQMFALAILLYQITGGGMKDSILR